METIKVVLYRVDCVEKWWVFETTYVIHSELVGSWLVVLLEAYSNSTPKIDRQGDTN